jgi:hypothetical protein
MFILIYKSYDYVKKPECPLGRARMNGLMWRSVSVSSKLIRLIHALLLKGTFDKRAEEAPCGSTGFFTEKRLQKRIKAQGSRRQAKRTL